MSKKTDIPLPPDEEWGNIELPGLSDEKLFETNWNVVAANRDIVKNRLANGWYEKNLEATQKTKNDPKVRHNRATANQKNAKKIEWQTANQKGVEKRKNNLQWHENHALAMKKIHADPMTAIKRDKGIKNRNKNNHIWRENMIRESSKAKFKPIKTEHGIFESLKSASEKYAEFWNTSLGYAKIKIMKEIKKGNPNFVYISKEEYIMLTGKDI